MAIVGAQRGYLRTGGFYGRFKGRRVRQTFGGGELKFFDTTLAATVATTGGVVNPNLVIIPTGDGQSNRDGRLITIKSIGIKGFVQIPSQAAVGATSDVCRIMVIQDTQANGAAFNVGNVLAQTTWLGMMNLENGSRFKVLQDKSYTLQCTGGLAAATFEATKQWGFYMRCSIPIIYDASAATGAITSQRTNSIAVLIISEGGFASVQYQARVRFTE